MNQNPNEKVNRKDSLDWPARVTREARRSVFIHGAVFAAINALLLTINHVMGHQFVEWPLLPWAAALCFHATAVALAYEVPRIRVRINRINAPGFGSF